MFRSFDRSVFIAFAAQTQGGHRREALPCVPPRLRSRFAAVEDGVAIGLIAVGSRFTPAAFAVAAILGVWAWLDGPRVPVVVSVARWRHVARHESLRDLSIVAPFEFDPRRRKPIGKFHEAVQRWQVGNIVGNDERRDLLLGRQCCGIADAVGAVTIGFVHLADLAVTDELSAGLGGLAVACFQDQLTANKARHILGTLAPIDRLQPRERMKTEHHGAPKAACGLQAVLDRR